MICRDRKYCDEEKRTRGKGGRRVNWNAEDQIFLPKVQAVVQELLDDSRPPQRVTVGGVARLLGLETAHLRRLPCCAAYVMKHYTSSDENRAKKLVWAVRKIDEARDTLNKQRVFELVHMDRHMIEAALPYLAEHAPAEECRRVKELVDI